MFKKMIVAAMLAAFAILGWSASAQADGFATRADRKARRYARVMSWHGNYYHTQYGYPVPVLVPPTANMQVAYGWGVSQTTMTPIYHQYQRPFPGHYSGGGGGGALGRFQSTPQWPSHTDQFGAYYIRGPW